MHFCITRFWRVALKHAMVVWQHNKWTSRSYLLSLNKRRILLPVILTGLQHYSWLGLFLHNLERFSIIWPLITLYTFWMNLLLKADTKGISKGYILAKNICSCQPSTYFSAHLSAFLPAIYSVIWKMFPLRMKYYLRNTL